MSGLFTRFAVIPTITIMFVAIGTIKVPLLKAKGLWDVARAPRTDYAMLLGSLFLLWIGAGRWSLDTVPGAPVPAHRLAQ